VAADSFYQYICIRTIISFKELASSLCFIHIMYLYLKQQKQQQHNLNFPQIKTTMIAENLSIFLLT
jgi:hypothetical protein